MGSGNNGNLNDIFTMTRENHALFTSPNLPSEEIAVKILLKKSVSSILKDLNRQLSTDNMKASGDRHNKNAVVVRGIPPDGNYDAQDILKVVRNYDREARISV